MQVFIIGAAGRIGTRLSRLLAQRGDLVTGMFRNRAHEPRVEASGARPVLGDLILDDVDALAEKMTGHDAVVFTAGAHGTGQEQTTLIDGEGVAKAAQAAKRAGVRSFVLVSAFPEGATTHTDYSESYSHYLRMKKLAEVQLAATDLDWVIIRPSRLLDEPGSGLVSAALALMEETVSRDNVAAFIGEVLRRGEPRRAIVELNDGSTPISEAVANVI